MADADRLDNWKIPLVDALCLSDARRKWPRYPLRSFWWAYLILVLVSFGMLYLGDRLNATGMALTRFMGAGQAAVTAQLGYPATGRDQIAVVLYDEQFLRAYDSAWPISYRDHADWLLRLAGTPGARPKAIFLDITFGQARRDATLPALVEALCTLRQRLHIPVFLAALPGADGGPLALRAGMAEGADACFTLVGVDYTPDRLDGFAWTYPLTHHLAPQGWTPGAPGVPGQPTYRSAALAIAQDAARLNLGEAAGPMALVWGHDAPAGAALPDLARGCVPARELWRNLTPGVFLQFSEPPPLCPYHRTLSMEQAGALPDDALAAWVKDRYVMVGASIPGHNDFAKSPVHGLMPGIHYHAMALDNLLTYGDGYKLDLNWDPDGLPQLLLPGLATILAVLAVHWGFWWAANALRRWPPAKKGLERCTGYPACRALTDDSTRTGRSGLAVLAALAWAARLTVQFGSAAGLIALLQYFSRAGMLPIVELIGMTLFAEAVGYLAKLRWYALGKEEAAPQPEPQTQPEPASDSRPDSEAEAA